MKLKSPDWKKSWFENHISERFFQEVTRLEHGTVNRLETSAQWMEQMTIELGQLAQSMIQLESGGSSSPQVRQAFEKSLRLSALALHLMVTLDGVGRQPGFGESSPAGRDTQAVPTMGVTSFSNPHGPLVPEEEPARESERKGADFLQVPGLVSPPWNVPDLFPPGRKPALPGDDEPPPSDEDGETTADETNAGELNTG